MPMDNWIVVTNKPLMQVWRKSYPGTAVVCQKFHTIIPDVTPRQLYFLNVDIPLRCKWDPVYGHKEFKILKDNLANGEYECYVVVVLPAFITTRDHINRVIFKEDFPEKGQYTVSSIATTHPDYPEPYKKRLRAELDYHHQIFEPWPEKNGTRVTEIFYNNMKGQMNQFMFSLGAKERPETFCGQM